jgi:hypothetical protein
MKSLNVLIFFSIFTLLFLAACSKISKAKTKNTDLMIINLEDCHIDRKNVSNIVNMEGKMSFLADSWVITLSNDDTQRYLACNLPTQEFKEGQIVIFGADVKEIFAHERRFATPCVLTSFSYK